MGQKVFCKKDDLVLRGDDRDISVGSCSDTHGLYDEKMVISHTVPGTFKDIDILEVDGWGISAGDIV